MLLFIILGLIAIVAAALAYGNRRWRSATEALLTKLDMVRRSPGGERYTSEKLDGLPPPVQRYFRTVLQEGQRTIAAVRLKQAGTFNMDGNAERWKAFSADQYAVASAPGFVWDARIAMLPGIAVRVHDAYAAGEGTLHASLFGLVTVAEMHGTPDTAEGELMRFLAEAPWYPTALLPSRGVQWEAVDAASAEATLSDGENSATLLFRFDQNGLVESVRAEARGRMVGETVVPTPWEGRWRRYERRDGMLIPLEGEVSWILPEGPKPYWRGRITKLAYEFAQ